MNPRKKILIFIDWFTPGYKAGGPIASIINFIHLMQDRYTLFVFTADTDLGDASPYPGIIPDQWTTSADGQLSVYYARARHISRRQILAAVTSVDPDFIYLNHLFSPWFVVCPLWLKLTGNLKAKIILCPRGALYESALSIKRYKKMPFIFAFRVARVHRMITFQATSERERAAILKYFPTATVRLADDLPETYQPPFSTVEKKSGLLRCIYISRIHPIKNLLFILEFLAKADQDITFTVIGPVEDQPYWDKCQEQITKLPPNVTVRYLGAIPNTQLRSHLADNHLFILPTKGENFGHSIFESFLAGRPVLISDQTPWLHLESKSAGWDLPLDRPASYGQAIQTAGSWNQHSFDAWASNAWNYARDYLSDAEFHRQYMKLFA